MIRARAVAVAGVVGATATAAYAVHRAPVCYHEAGHAVVALHVQTCGVSCSNGWCATYTGSRPLVAYTTVRTRQTEKGSWYLGETKLCVRWRHMDRLLRWHRGSGVPGAGEAEAGRAADAQCHAALIHFDCADLPAPTAGGIVPAAAPPPPWLTTLARISYLMGGKAAEVQLGHGPPAPHLSGHGDEARARASAALGSRAGLAAGDADKARRLSSRDLGAEVGDAAAEITIAAAYEHAQRVIAARWAEVGAVAGALLVAQTLSGEQIERLVRDARDAVGRRRVNGEQYVDPERHVDDGRYFNLDGGRRRVATRLLTAAAPWPFLFGCVWGAARA